MRIVAQRFQAGDSLTYGQLRAQGRCVACYNPSDNFRLCARCRGFAKRRSEKLRLAVFRAYGGPVCKCCGEKHLVFLSIDHIDGGGNAHRKEINRTGIGFYRWLKINGFPPGFQVLCHNCNQGKHSLGECPHVTEKREADEKLIIHEPVATALEDGAQ